MKEARKSVYGKEVMYLWTGHFNNEGLTSEVVPSTLVISNDERNKIDEAFITAKAKNPHYFDGTLWRYEGHKEVRGGIQFLLSETTYGVHNILRNERLPAEYKNGRFLSHYPNPFSINALQRTLDGYLLIGVKGKISDQTGNLGVMGAGFVKRDLNEGKSLSPKNIFAETLRECGEETAYVSGTEPLESEREKLIALGTIFGSNHDTTTCVYVPLRAKKSEVDIGNQEHSDLLFLEDEPSRLERFLNEGGINEVPACDHLIGCVELYLQNKECLTKK
jgi:hypothetical protein